MKYFAIYGWGRRHGGATNITMAKSFFGGKYLINTEYRHKKLFSLILTVTMGRNCLDPKIGPKK